MSMSSIYFKIYVSSIIDFKMYVFNIKYKTKLINVFLISCPIIYANVKNNKIKCDNAVIAIYHQVKVKWKNAIRSFFL